MRSENRIGFQAVTLDGERIALQFTRSEKMNAENADGYEASTYNTNSSNALSKSRSNNAANMEVLRMEIRSTSENLFECLKR